MGDKDWLVHKKLLQRNLTTEQHVLMVQRYELTGGDLFYEARHHYEQVQTDYFLVYAYISSKEYNPLVHRHRICYRKYGFVLEVPN